MIDESLVRGVELLCLDAGNTIIFLDHARLADVIRDATGVTIAASALVIAEGAAKRAMETASLVDVAWSAREQPGAASWGKIVASTAHFAGVPEEHLSTLLERAWRTHQERNLWCKVPDGLPDALVALRAAGVKTAVVSNSEGIVARVIRDVGLEPHLDLIVDSGLVGVEKPDPRIFAVALDRFRVHANAALHLGDTFTTDILGARAAGIRCALIDPFAHYEGLHPDVPRVPGATEVARAITSQASRSSSGLR